jgi:hypothetical protein
MPMSPARYGILQLRQFAVFHWRLGLFVLLAPVAVVLGGPWAVAAAGQVPARVGAAWDMIRAAAAWGASHG